jgi:hypothetical protein
MLLRALATWLLLSPELAFAGFVTADDLRIYCHDYSDKCVGYIMGSIDAQVVDLKKVICLPPQFNVAGGVVAVQDYLEAHPQLSDSDGSVVVFGALASRYPCR